MKKAAKKTTGKYQKRSKKRTRYIVAILAAVAILATALTMGYLFLGRVLGNNIIMDNVYVAGVDVGGMTKEEAIQAIDTAVSNTYKTQSMRVTVLDQMLTLDPNTTGANLDVAAAVELAFNYGRSDSSSQNALDQLQSMTGKIHVDILSCLNLNKEAIRKELADFAAQFDSQLTQPTYQIIGTVGENQNLIITAGTPGYDLVFDDLYNHVLDSYNQGAFQVDHACKRTDPLPIDLEKIHSETYIEAVNSEIDPETFTATAHTFGYHFDLENAKTMLSHAADGESVTLAYLCTVPEVTQEQLTELLFRDVLASYTAKASSSQNRDTNLRLACQAVNGIILAPGEVFDYNKALGERTAEKGYQYAASYYGNQTISTIGGGICQVSSTLYYCAMMSDLEIVTRINHGFLNTYVPMGMDATVSWGGPEFRFRNDTQYPIRIEASASGGQVTIKLVGTHTKDYYVKMKYEVLETTEYEIIEQEMPADNEKGYRDGDIIISPYTGYKVVTYRCKYDKQTDRMISKTKEAESIYNKRDQVVCKIVTDETLPTDPSTTPSDETTVPSDETTVPSDETTLPSDETTVPSEEVTAPSDETTLPEDTTPEESTVPGGSTSPVSGGTVTEDG